MNLYLHTLKQYAVFNGRATRAELWTFLIVNVIIKIILAIASVKMGLYITDNPNEDRTLLDGLFAIAVFLPTIAVSVRRIHDIGLSGWWGWIFMPFMIPMIIVSFIDSKEDNKYGTNLKYSTNLNNKPWNIVGLIIILLLAIGVMVNFQNSGNISSKSYTLEEGRIACDGGDMNACGSLGSRYLNARGVSQDYFKAAEFLGEACDGGILLRCNQLGIMYQIGKGVNQDYFRAVELYRTACDGGYPNACGNLSVMFEKGLGGVKKNNLMAIKLYRKACDGGDTDSCGLLGFQYLAGNIVRQDKKKAKELFGIACDGGDTAGCEEYTKLNEEGY